MRKIRFRRACALAIVLTLGLSSASFAVQKEGRKKKTAPSGTPVLWREHADVSALDLFHGPGGREMVPDTSSITFIEEETGGYSKKYRVRDGAGRVWVAKIGDEAQSETAASRLVWAAGYPAEITYLVPSVTIPGKGTFENVRFEARPENVERLDAWRWEKNPFAGRRELQGLKVLMAFLENWDLKDDNNRVLLVRGSQGNELHYVVSDLGATFGRAGGPSGPISWFKQIKGSRNVPEDYAGSGLIERVEGGKVRLRYEGKNSGMMKSITVAEARWLGDLLARLTDEQIADAFRAANYGPEDVTLLTRAVRKRVGELTSLQAR